MKNIQQQADEIVSRRMAKFVKDYEGDEPLGSTPIIVHRISGHYEGYGFCSENVCPNRICQYYKYTSDFLSPVCTHPQVIWKVELGGVHTCPSILQGCLHIIRKGYYGAKKYRII